MDEPAVEWREQPRDGDADRNCARYENTKLQRPALTGQREWREQPGSSCDHEKKLQCHVGEASWAKEFPEVENGQQRQRKREKK